jgi:phospholipid/cholesterol/gamma-HCH transport system ATP-binding protein
MIEISDVYKSFNGKPVLNGVDLVINKGETITIIGRSGEGKSVLLKHLIGLLKPDRGKVIIDGIDINTRSEREKADLRRRFGMLFQGAALFDSMRMSGWA